MPASSPTSRLVTSTPHALTLLRMLLAPAYVVALTGIPEGNAAGLGGHSIGAPAGDVSRAGATLAASALTPLLIASLASASDFIDGRLARWLGSASRRGAALDIAADAAFVLFALAALASRGEIPLLHPIAAAAALGGLALTWRSRRGDLAGTSQSDGGATAPSRSIADRFGHAAGIANYAIVVAASVVLAGLASAPWLWAASAAVAVLNLAPLALRLARR